MVAAFFDHALWQHAEVADDRDACRGDRADFFRLADATFEFHCFGTGGDELACGVEGHFGRVVGVDRQVADDDGLRFRARNGGDMVQHVIERDMGRVRKTQHHHAE